MLLVAMLTVATAGAGGCRPDPRSDPVAGPGAPGGAAQTGGSSAGDGTTGPAAGPGGSEAGPPEASAGDGTGSGAGAGEAGAGPEVVWLDPPEAHAPGAVAAVTTDPPAAFVYADGTYVGLTPLRLGFSRPHVLTLVRSGFAWRQEILGRTGSPAADLRLELEPGGLSPAAAADAFAAGLPAPGVSPTDLGYVIHPLGPADFASVAGRFSPGGGRLAFVIEYPLPDPSSSRAAVLWVADFASGRVRRLGQRVAGPLGDEVATPGIIIAGWLDDRWLAVIADDPGFPPAPDPDQPGRWEPGWQVYVIDTGAAIDDPTGERAALVLAFPNGLAGGGRVPGYLRGRGPAEVWTARAEGRNLVFCATAGPGAVDILALDPVSGAVWEVVAGLTPSEEAARPILVSPDGLKVAYGYDLGGIGGRGIYTLPGGTFAPGPPDRPSGLPVLTAAPLWSPSSERLAFIVAEPGRPWTWLADGSSLLLLGNAVLFSDPEGRLIRPAEEEGRLWTWIAWAQATDTLLAVGVSAGPGGESAAVLVQDGLFLIDEAGRYDWAVRGEEASRVWPLNPQPCPGWFVLGREKGEGEGFAYFLLPEGAGLTPGPGSGPGGSLPLPAEPVACLAPAAGGAGESILLGRDWERPLRLSLACLSVPSAAPGEAGAVTLTSVEVPLPCEVWGFAPADRPSPVVYACGVAADGRACLLVFTYEKAVEACLSGQ